MSIAILLSIFLSLWHLCLALVSGHSWWKGLIKWVSSLLLWPGFSLCPEGPCARCLVSRVIALTCQSLLRGGASCEIIRSWLSACGRDQCPSLRSGVGLTWPHHISQKQVVVKGGHSVYKAPPVQGALCLTILCDSQGALCRCQHRAVGLSSHQLGTK